MVAAPKCDDNKLRTFLDAISLNLVRYGLKEADVISPCCHRMHQLVTELGDHGVGVGKDDIVVGR